MKNNKKPYEKLYKKVSLKSLLLSLMIALTGISGCVNESTPIINNDSAGNKKIIIDFEDERYLSAIKFENIKAQRVVKAQASQDDKYALTLSLLAKKNYKSSITFKPKSSWNWSAHKNVSFALDITNPSIDATHLFVAIADKKGKLHNRSVIIPKQFSGTYYVELSGGDLDFDTGIRSNPARNDGQGTPFIWRWGDKKLDLSAITSVKFSVASLLKDRTLVFDNLRLIENTHYGNEHLAGLVDEFGQNDKLDYPYKIKSLAQLKNISAKELASLSGKVNKDRSKFGGWLTGPKLAATGYFRTEKHNGEWSLVDPEGHLFFSTGIANVRMSNTSTITGYDFSAEHIQKRSLDDVTPEDSKGLNGVKGEALATKYVSSELRSNMFTWLPEYNEPLAKHYGYRRSVHSGPIKQGETYSFYQANLERKYGEDFLNIWREVTLNRMLDWGFTSFGNWIDPSFYHLNKVPYFANGWIIGDFKEVSSGADYWSPLPDPFDPKFVERAQYTVSVIADEVKNNPWCVGVFIDNEKSWGSDGSTESQYGIVINTLRRADTDSPTKAVFTQKLKEKYKTIQSLNKSWATNLSSWQEVESGVDLSQFTDSQIADYSMLLKTYANEYFNVVKTALKKVLPNHLYMGARFADWGMTPEVVEAAAMHADVVSYNFYKEGLHPAHWTFLAEIDKPSIIGEFHIGATDTGLLNPGLVHAENQAGRAQMYQNYMQTVIENPYFVGAHWFQYTDSPLTGRAYDGENYNVGFVSVTDTPYPAMINAVKEFNRNLYQRKFGTLKTTGKIK